jgi:hypothetical protein
MNNTKFQAYAKDCRITGDTPKDAASKFFSAFPTKRKCNIIEGVLDGPFFVVAYDSKKWPYSKNDVTKKMVNELLV